MNAGGAPGRPASGRRARLIAFEGVEGSGKSTQAARLAERLGAVLTREPGGTALGERVRELVLGPGLRVAPRAEALLMAADRAQHVAEVIGPALAEGHDVVTDRFSPSSLAYQGHGRGLGLAELATVSAWAAAGVEPDLVILLDVDPAVGRSRRDGARDRFESEDDAFHQRVAAGYRALAAADPDRWTVVDGSAEVEEVAGQVLAAFEAWAAVRASP